MPRGFSAKSLSSKLGKAVVNSLLETSKKQQDNKLKNHQSGVDQNADDNQGCVIAGVVFIVLLVFSCLMLYHTIF